MLQSLKIWVGQVKYVFHKKYFRKNEPLTSWTHFPPVFFQISADWLKLHYLHEFCNGFFCKNKFSTNQHWSGKKRGKKVFNWSEVHFFRSPSYEIHTLVMRRATAARRRLLICQNLGGGGIRPPCPPACNMPDVSKYAGRNLSKSIFRLFSGAISFVFQTRHNKEMKIYENNTLLSYLALTYILYTI